MERQRSELGEFLRSRRARLRPEDVGLPDYGGRRRVPGLRREELAQLAGVSAGYYTRLEQGQSPNASEAVLDAIARVLRLDETELAHLMTAVRHPHDAELTGLVGELTVHSPEFASLWAAHPVQDCAVRYTREFRHPLVGAMTLNNEIMELSNDEGQRMAVFTATPGTPSAEALTLLTGQAGGTGQPDGGVQASALKTASARSRLA